MVMLLDGLLDRLQGPGYAAIDDPYWAPLAQLPGCGGPVVRVAGNPSVRGWTSPRSPGRVAGSPGRQGVVDVVWSRLLVAVLCALVAGAGVVDGWRATPPSTTPEQGSVAGVVAPAAAGPVRAVGPPPRVPALLAPVPPHAVVVAADPS